MTQGSRLTVNSSLSTARIWLLSVGRRSSAFFRPFVLRPFVPRPSSLLNVPVWLISNILPHIGGGKITDHHQPPDPCHHVPNDPRAALQAPIQKFLLFFLL